MNWIASWTHAPLVERLGWTLIHSLWEIAAVAVCCALALSVLRRQTAQSRYLTACVALAVCLLAPAATFVAMDPAVPTGGPSGGLRVSAPVITALTLAPSMASRVNGWLPWLVFAWIAGLAAFSIRLAGGLLVAERLRTTAVEPVSEECERLLKELTARLRMTRPVRLLESKLAGTPVTIGFLRPVILLPVAALIGLDRDQFAAILAHELAHIRRADYLVNLVQRIVETVLFYHPAVWWISRQARREREHCCDDLAVSVCGGPLPYAQALSFLEQQRAASQLALAATGGDLLARIRRLLHGSDSAAPRVGAGASLAVLLMMAAGLAAWQAPPPPPAPPQVPRRSTPAAPAGPGAPTRTAPAAPAAPRPPLHLLSDEAIAIVEGSSTRMFHGSRADRDHIRQLGLEGTFIWFRKQGQGYVVSDRHTIEQALDLFRPQEELGARQAELGRKQAELGERQAELGRKQAGVQAAMPDLTAQIRRIQERMQSNAVNPKTATHDELARLQARIAELQAQLGELQARAGAEQARLGGEQAKLGGEQAKLGEEQAKLGAEQARLANEAATVLRELLDEAIAKGLARPDSR